MGHTAHITQQGGRRPASLHMSCTDYKVDQNAPAYNGPGGLIALVPGGSEKPPPTHMLPLPPSISSPEKNLREADPPDLLHPNHHRDPVTWTTPFAVFPAIWGGG